MTVTPSRAFPSITNLIRLDHGHVTALFHRYHVGTSKSRKAAIAKNACLGLEIHAQLEEEIFYPALAKIEGHNDVLAKSKAEHDSMRRLIGTLRAQTAGTPEFDQTFFELMRAVLHHVADEESTLLPEAERALADQLGPLGFQMAKRRVQLIAPHAGEVTLSGVQSFPVASFVVAAGIATLGTALVMWLGRGNGAVRPRDIGEKVTRSPSVRKLRASVPHVLH
jgi:hypothetical protein